MKKQLLMNVKKYGLLLILLLFNSAHGESYPLELTNKLEIIRLDVTSSGIIQLLSKNGNWGKSCPDANHAQILPSHKAYRELYAQGLAAQMSGSRVFFYARCTSHPKIIHIENMYKE